MTLGPYQIVRSGGSVERKSAIHWLMNQRMFPLTLPGLEGAMRLLVK